MSHAVAQGSGPNPLDAIRARFLAGLEDRLAELDALLNMLDGTEDAPRVWSEIRLRAHRIAGAAGSLGFAALGVRAAQIDAGIERLQAWPESIDQAVLRQAVDSLLDDIDAILEDAA